MTRFLKNTTSSRIKHTNSGIAFQAGEYQEATDPLLQDQQTRDWLGDGTMVFNDGTDDFSGDTGYYKLVKEAFGVRFSSGAERSNGFISTNVQEAIEEVNSNISKKSGILILCYNGSGTSLWLGFGDKLVPTNDSPWSPPFDCHITQVQFTNKKNGKNSSNKTINEIKCHSMSYSESRSVNTSDSLAWYVNNWPSSNLIRESGNGRTWEYDNSSEGDHMYKNTKYAFRIENLAGYNPNDVIITLLVEEL